MCPTRGMRLDCSFAKKVIAYILFYPADRGNF